MHPATPDNELFFREKDTVGMSLTIAHKTGQNTRMGDKQVRRLIRMKWLTGGYRFVPSGDYKLMHTLNGTLTFFRLKRQEF